MATEKCWACHGPATRAGKQYGARCKECDSYVEFCTCTDRCHPDAGVRNLEMSDRARRLLDAFRQQGIYVPKDGGR